MPDLSRAEKASIDETARLLLMDDPELNLLGLHRELQAHHDGVNSSVIADLWSKYRGYDGRTQPTHDVTTGERLTGLRR